VSKAPTNKTLKLINFWRSLGQNGLNTRSTKNFGRHFFNKEEHAKESEGNAIISYRNVGKKALIRKESRHLGTH